MQLRISAWAIRNPIPVVVLFIALLIAGVAGYRDLQVKLFPDVSFPLVNITVTLPGAAPSEVETQITRLVEAAVSNVARVEHVTSTVSVGTSSTSAEFEIGVDPQEATDEIRAAVDRIRSSLPRAILEPIVERFDVDSQPIVTYSVTAPSMTDVELSWFVENTVARRIIGEEGVGQVSRVGGVDREINVVLDPSQMAALGLTAPQVNDALREFNVDSSGGSARIGGREQTVRVLGSAATVEALRSVVIPTVSGRTTRLSNVAEVNSGAAERTSLALLNSVPVVGFKVMKTKTASDVSVETRTANVVAALAEAHPDVEFRLIVSNAANTQNSFEATVESLLEGMLLTAIVVFVFLRDWRATVITAFAMPISLIPSFAVMSALGFSLNMITLLALTLVIGILVDDAIVEIENIQKRVQAGQSPYQAAYEGADQIGLAVLATTMAIVVVFLPVSLMGGIVGQFFFEFGITVGVTVTFSLLVARLLTPLMAAYFLLPSPEPHARKPFTGHYRRVLEFALDHRNVSVVVGLAVFAVSLWLATLLPTGFNPPSDNGIVEMSIETAPGTTLDDMRAVTTYLTAELRKRNEVTDVFVTVSPGSGNATILLTEDREMTTQEFQTSLTPLLHEVPDVRLGFVQSGGGGSTTVQILLSSEDGNALSAAALALEQQMRTLPELYNVHQVTPRPGSELVIRLKPGEAARLGVTPESVATLARVATIGDVDANSAKFNTGAQQLTVRTRLSDAARSDLTVLGALRVPTSSGGTVPLSAVADLSFQSGDARIERYDRERRATIEAELNGVSLGEATTKIEALPILKNLPAGVRQPAYGDSERQKELFAKFGFAIAAGIGLIFAVLVLLFRSFFKPITILAALPLSLAGAFLGLLVGGSVLGLSALIGLLMLMGLAAKNSILLVEFAIEAERAGATQRDALIAACQERARPIVMTTIAMASGMLPTALGLGEGSEFRVPMAMAVIGGLISSTVLSLVLVPVVYEFIDDIELWVSPRLRRFLTPRPGVALEAPQ